MPEAASTAASNTAATRTQYEGGSVTLSTGAGRVTIRVSESFDELRDSWLALQRHAVCSYSQSYYWAEGWHRIVAAPEGARAVLIHGRDAQGECRFILPFELGKSSGQRVIRFIGQDHANYNTGLFQPAFASALNRRDIDEILCAAVDMIGGADAALFCHQPRDIGGYLNPFAHMPHTDSANSGYALKLQSDFKSVYEARVSKNRRSNLTRSERRLASEGPVTVCDAASAAESAALLDVCFAQKRERFAERGIEDSFAEQRYRDFYKEMAALERREDGKLNVSCLKVGEEIAATRCRVALGGRHNDVISSITSGPLQALSPGQVLLRHQIEQACAAGYIFEDFGAGAAPHKDIWCDSRIALFDSHLALSPKGHALCAYEGLKTRLKHMVKTTPALWETYQDLRKRLRGK
ncbi:MAG: GNAT family N-acetyltransferase [Pseudomonadota bacterium]|nr:GNAT family N-acetyltransferase [Pseudomonadota bacterium]